jgi:potassium/hydrogen antiporter
LGGQCSFDGIYSDIVSTLHIFLYSMTSSIIITICTLLLLAYVFDISSKLTKIPSVILLLILGWVVKQVSGFLGLHIPDLTPLLPVFGTIGLILIVLEGTLELELNKSKLPLIKMSFLVAILPMIIFSLLLAWVFNYFGNVPFKSGLVNAIPFAVISSAVAIPSVRNLDAGHKEFIVYESSLSDIFGVLFFNFIAVREALTAASFGQFALEMLIVIVLSFVLVLGLSFLLSRIKYHITFTPIMLLVILIYFVSKEFHLPGLIFILVFGLFLGNLDEMKQFKWLEVFRPRKLDKEVRKFKAITVEATFFIRALFFLMFGFLMDVHELLNLETLPWAGGIVAAILILRLAVLKISKMSLDPLLYIAPRGLITILLFLAIIPEQMVPMVNKSLIIQTIVLSVIVMMIGIMTSKSEAQPDTEKTTH